MDRLDTNGVPPMVGFAWRRIPGISQHKLGLESLFYSSFDKWSHSFLQRYDLECARSEHELQEQIALFEREGVLRKYVAPEGVGSVKLKVIDRLLRELNPGTFVLVASWGLLGSQSIVEQIVTEALEQDCFFILPQHKSIRLLPPTERRAAHKSWVLDSIVSSYTSASSKRDQILALQEQGMSPEDIQLELGMSKSTYYRHLDSTVPVSSKRKQLIELLNNGHTPTEIQARLGMSSSTYYRILGQMTFSDTSGNTIHPKQEK